MNRKYLSQILNNGARSVFADGFEAARKYLPMALNAKKSDAGKIVADKVRIYPRTNLADRINNCKVCGSNSGYNSDLVELATITGVVSGNWAEVPFVNSTGYKYYSIHGNAVVGSSPEAAEIEFYKGATLLTALEIGASSELGGFGKERAFDGDTATEYANEGEVNGYIGIRVS